MLWWLFPVAVVFQAVLLMVRWGFVQGRERLLRGDGRMKPKRRKRNEEGVMSKKVNKKQR